MILDRIKERVRAAVAQIVAEEVTTDILGEVTSPAAPKAPVRKAETKRASGKAVKAAKGKAVSAKPAKKVREAAGGTRYRLDETAVLEKLRLYGEAGVRAEVLRGDWFSDVPAPVLLRGLKKLIEAGLAEVRGARRAATYSAVASEAATVTVVEVDSEADAEVELGEYASA